ncbi:serine/threonine-protein kinase ATG1-like [Dendronephthya gigantea]|uniref:serine/threonine-protein kinase ATG1-like n=1 Tax=Dendronephthya gigantea TaxID=151771 RepID=UPI00106CBF9D|nr:serine/threonine-protein kinase ATG1-like [Dendronephthya gigantea]
MDTESLLERAEPILKRRDFTLKGILGKGSFGLVVQVENKHDEKFAIKILRSTNDQNDDNAKYQKRELKLLENYKNDLWNQNILKYYHSWLNDIDNIPYLFIQTEPCFKSLLDFIYDNTIAAGSEIVQVSSPRPLWAQVFPQILNGLQALRQIGWVHRDIHPGNILVANPPPQQITEIVVKIADFGYAREIGSIIEASLPLTVAPLLPPLSSDRGNKLFRAPELETGSYDYKVDLYSAGIVLYFLSRYLPDKSQWPDEIKELRNGNRGPDELSHQNDKLFHLLTGLMKQNPNERPTVDMALQYIQGESTGLTERKFFVKKQGDEIYYRCITPDDSLKSLQAAIQEHSNIGIEANAQIIIQEKMKNTRENQEKPVEKVDIFVGITSDRDVRDMFHSTEKLGRKVRIVVTDRRSQVVDTGEEVALNL